MGLGSTNHAYTRAKQRLGWKKSTLDRMLPRAIEEGIKRKDTAGELRRYLDGLWNSNRVCNNIRIYGEVVYLFQNHSLITIYRLPQRLIKYLPNYR